MAMNMYLQLQEINRRPAPFEHYTAAELWTDEHTSSRMLNNHLNGSNDVSSRNTEFIAPVRPWACTEQWDVHRLCVRQLPGLRIRQEV